MARPEQNKLTAYFYAHMVPTLDRHEHGEFKLNKIPVGMNDRRMGELTELLNAQYGEYTRTNGKRGGIVVVKDTKKGVIAINLNGEIRTVRAKRDRSRSYVAAKH